MKARLAPEAEQDADDAIAWYDLKSAALGDEFLRRVNKCIQSIERYPEMFPRVYRKMRRALVETFPYQVLYEIDPEEISCMPSIIAREIRRAGRSVGRHNTPLQTDERRAAVPAYCRVTLAPLAAERQNR